MNPLFWGPHGWIFLHSITFAYPHNPSDDEKKQYFEFFHNLHYVLPCYKCAEHYKKHIQKYPLTDTNLSTRKNLIEWLILVHNQVNISLGKKILTTQEVIQDYNTKIHNTRYKNIIYDYLPHCFLLLMVVFVLFFLIRKYV
jgi:hypothetical protein